MRILSCLVVTHNPWLILLALAVGITGSWVTFRLFRQARTRVGRQRAGWVLLASQAAGSSIWCVHFIAVVAYDAGAAFTFDPAWTMVSLFVAVAGCAYGFWAALSKGIYAAPEMGGMIVGLAISAMHYSGMLAFRIDGLIEWQAGYILLSLAFSVFFGVLTMRQAVRPFIRDAGYLAVAFFMLAVLSLHFTGMAALAVTPIAVGSQSASSSALAAFAVVGVGMLVAGSGVISYLLDEQASQENLRRLEHLALHDALTGLANRLQALAYLDRTFAEAQKSQEKVAVIGIDLDRFKEINDVYGHKAGDDVLITIGRRLAGLLREDEFVARIGGDEFMAVKRFSDRTALDSFLARLDAALTTPLSVAGNVLPSMASIGVAIFPDDGADREMLICHADLAMYQSKHDLSRRISFYEPAMEQATLERYALAQDLGRALELGQFALHYQVQKNVASGRIVGYEALLRWNHPLHGSISPAVFIPIAEETGHILAIGEWVLRAVLLETGLPAKRLELEITESTFIADKAKALHALRQVKALGVFLAIDDFGVGYSSFDTLRTFPFDKIKIDGCFTRDADRSSEARAILRSVLALGRSLGIPVLAEGVETSAQLALLRAEGCAEAQGYHLGKPAPLERARPVAMRAG
jgi:diguanylate cyclase (GGDEF)-like protein